MTHSPQALPEQREIERKFLLAGPIPAGLDSVMIRQGYLAGANGVSVRIRQRDHQYFLSVKAKIDHLTRHEFEYEVPAADGELMLALHCQLPPIEKRRYFAPEASGLVWEIDEFFGENQGLWVAELELPHADHPFEQPAWLGQEVSDDARYLNTALAKTPYTQWPSIASSSP